MTRKRQRAEQQTPTRWQKDAAFCARVRRAQYENISDGGILYMYEAWCAGRDALRQEPTKCDLC